MIQFHFNFLLDQLSLVVHFGKKFHYKWHSGIAVFLIEGLKNKGKFRDLRGILKSSTYLILQFNWSYITPVFLYKKYSK